MSSEQYYHSVFHQDQFNDSIVIRPISLKPTIMSSFLIKNNQQQTTLSTYDHVKLTDYLEQDQNGTIINFISLQQNSLVVQLTSEGNQFLQKYSATQFAFLTVLGEAESGKSFLIDKILNLSNVQGNKFCISHQKPGIYLWSVPFLKDDLRIFIVQLAKCPPESKQLDILLPYVLLLSSGIINLESFKQKQGYQSSKILEEKMRLFQNRFVRESGQNQFVKKLYNSLFPQRIINVKRTKEQNGVKRTKEQNGFQTNMLSFAETYLQQFYLPNAKNSEYRGIDQDLKVHSFLNKKCINEQYIHKASELFKKLYSVVFQKKQGQLVFNGSILIKYLHKLSSIFQRKKPIDLQQLYYDIMKDLYVSAYNYCVITYHEMLEQALSDEKPRSIDELLKIFEDSSNEIFDKYNEFTLEKSLHEQYEEKLIQHIESKEQLIIEINKKKANLQLSKIYENKINLNDMANIWRQITDINKSNSQYLHGQYDVLGKKLVQYLPKLLQGSNEEQKNKQQIQFLNHQIQQKINIAKQLKLINEEKRDKRMKIVQEVSKKKSQMQNKLKDYDEKISTLKREIKIYSKNEDLDGGQLQSQKYKYEGMSQQNLKKINKLQQQAKSPVQNNKLILQTKQQIQNVKKKQERLAMTLAEISKEQKNVEQNVEKQVNAKVIKKSAESNAIKQSKTSKQNKTIKQSKNSKQAAK